MVETDTRLISGYWKLQLISKRVLIRGGNKIKHRIGLLILNMEY